MPLYLVRWPDLTASLVRARDEDQLIEVLDQVGNPDGCTWSVYRGPLFLDFRLPATWRIRGRRPDQPVSPEQIVVDDVDAMLHPSVADSIEVALADGDEGMDTGEAIVRKAFPKVHAVFQKLYDGNSLEQEPEIPKEDLRKALHAELAQVVQTSWRQASLEKKSDPVSTLAREMDMPVSLARRLTESVASRQAGDDDEDRPPDSTER